VTRHPTVLPALAGAAGMAFVGGSVAVSGTLADAPLFTVQSLRYALACLLLLAWARRTRTRITRPRGTQWLWLAGVVVSGMFVFNIALVHGARHAEPAVIGVAVACVPLVLAAAGPRAGTRLLAAAGVVTAGAALVSGLGHADLTGLLLAALTFACEAGFTLLAVPVLRTHGPLGVSVHSTWLAALLFGACGLVAEGPAAVTRLHADDVLAGAYLAVLMTAVAFVLWYTCVTRLGTARAGLFTGITPVAAALVGVALGGPLPRPAVWAGVALVGAGLALGLRRPAGPLLPGTGVQQVPVELGQ
jgi:drug/metabolite transporter (DMT)-like permease